MTNRTLELLRRQAVRLNGGYTAHRAGTGTGTGKSRKSITKPPCGRRFATWRKASPASASSTGEKSIRAAESKEKALEKEKEQLVVPEAERESLHFGFTVQYESGNDVVRAEELAMGFPGRFPL